MDPYELHGFTLEISRTSHDSRYHDLQTVTVRVLDPATGEAIHTASAGSRSGHQLKKKHRSAEDPLPDALAAAERWLLENREDARENRQRAQAIAAAERVRVLHARWEALGRDDVALLQEQALALNATRLAEVLGFRSARQANAMLVEWGLQTRTYSGYRATDPAHARLGGFYAQLTWTGAGVVAIWRAGLAAGFFSGGDAELMRRVRLCMPWLPPAEPTP